VAQIWNCAENAGNKKIHKKPIFLDRELEKGVSDRAGEIGLNTL
jgi:hypothetical protein